MTDDEWLQQMAEIFARNAPYAEPHDTYQTALSPKDELKFRSWVTANKVPFNPRDEIQDYDMRGFYRGLTSGDPDAATAVNQTDGRMHFPDKWKTPFHHSFSAESQYASPAAPRWQNDTQLADPKTGDVVWDERYFGQPEGVDSARLQPARAAGGR